MKIYPLDNTMAELSIGTLVNEPQLARVLKCYKKGERLLNDSFAYWVAICELPNNTLHPFVVWNVVARPEGFFVEQGDYCRDMLGAEQAYIKRGGE